jgi:hypothetical protein
MCAHTPYEDYDCTNDACVTVDFDYPASSEVVGVVTASDAAVGSGS